jgi:hypothetical protein
MTYKKVAIVLGTLFILFLVVISINSLSYSAKMTQLQSSIHQFTTTNQNLFAENKELVSKNKLLTENQKDISFTDLGEVEINHKQAETRCFDKKNIPATPEIASIASELRLKNREIDTVCNEINSALYLVSSNQMGELGTYKLLTVETYEIPPGPNGSSGEIVSSSDVNKKVFFKLIRWNTNNHILYALISENDAWVYSYRQVITMTRDDYNPLVEHCFYLNDSQSEPKRFYNCVTFNVENDSEYLSSDDLF